MNTGYLLSGAISPTHFAVVQRVENATSAAELDAVCRHELDQIQHRLEKGKGRVNDDKITEALVLVLFLEDQRAFPVASGAVDFALVHALNLAEGGKNRKMRALGYTYLGLALKPSNDLSLLLFNSIIKDLQSANIASIATALRAIVHVPSADIAPAVQRQLVHLVSHKSAEVRRLALAALRVLAQSAPSVLDELRERKVWKRLKDRNPSVQLQAIKVLRKMMEHGTIDMDAAVEALLEVLRAPEPGQRPEVLEGVRLEIVRTLCAPEIMLDESRNTLIVGAVTEVLKQSAQPQTLAYHLATYSTTLPRSFWAILFRLVLPVVEVALASTEQNDVYFALRCLEAFSAGDANGVLSQPQALERVAAELQSEDAAVRKMAIRILARLSPDLPAVHLARLLDALHQAKEGRDILAYRALEVAVIEVRDLQPAEKGGRFARAVVSVAQAAGEGAVIEGVVQETLDWLHAAPEEAQNAFASALLTASSTAQSSRTLAVVASAVLCELGSQARLDTGTAVRFLTAALVAHDSPSVQQAVLAALAGLYATLPSAAPSSEAVEAVATLRDSASRHVRKRCEVFLQVAAAAEGFGGMKPYLSDLALPNVLHALEAYARTLLPPTPQAPSSAPSQRTGSAIGLRYDAYPSPAGLEPAGSRRTHRRRKEGREPGPRTAAGAKDGGAEVGLERLTLADSTAEATSPAPGTLQTDLLAVQEDADAGEDPFRASPVDRHGR